MALPIFQNLNELNDFLSIQEKRIQELEADNAALLCELENQFVTKDKLKKIIDQAIPKTGLFSESLFTRAFSIWGHFIFAQVFIGLIFAIGYFVIFILILKSIGSH